MDKVLCFDNAKDNDNANNINANNTIKDTKLYVPVVTLSARDNQKLTKLLSKVFKRLVYWNEYIGMNIKQKRKIKIRQMNIDIFSNQILLESIDYLFYLFCFIQMKITILKDLKLKGITYQKELFTIIA